MRFLLKQTESKVKDKDLTPIFLSCFPPRTSVSFPKTVAPFGFWDIHDCYTETL